jgi:predicted RecA/RadA family phage recombinase
MTNSYKQPGKTLSLVAPYARASSGLGAKMGAIFGVSCDAIENGATGRFETEGVHELDKVSAQAWAQGDRIFWDDSAKLCTNVATAGMLIGYATAAAANPTAKGSVKLLGVAPALLEGVQAAIADGAAITGGEAPTEAEHNALNSRVNSILAALRTVGIIAP